MGGVRNGARYAALWDGVTGSLSIRVEVSAGRAFCDLEMMLLDFIASVTHSGVFRTVIITLVTWTKMRLTRALNGVNTCTLLVLFV